MNFLSHFYFDRHTNNCYHVLGTVMPDLLKNADKTIVLHPEHLTHPDKHIMSLIGGWQKHLDVDRHFHSSEFFSHHSHQLKLALLPALQGSPVKPFFLGHIGIELILDNLLITTGKVNVDDFYDHLRGCDDQIITDFLNFSGMKEPQKFTTFFDGFKRSEYLRTYEDASQVAYALKRICMRIWRDPFTREQEVMLSEIILNYRAKLEPAFMEIFDLISSKL
ncbi:hypothetical protein [Mucilaginibacter ginkgonis]|uniref:Acyl carrier protein phosphodiesterase n=1 Tax=Mucilaginibacter ginkgonis TaxID=2682091 RepID=A0A6I4I3L7_9SPHI|nr:hypothetical protein [Mucilaginibacter ginkgonis]QQL48639.1 hypothetical protein GO620_010645 [Mucilaginibacter ginkgonis]